MIVYAKTTVVVIRPLPKVISHPPVILTTAFSHTDNETIFIQYPLKDVPGEVTIYVSALIMAPRAPTDIMERLYEENKDPGFYYSVA